MLFDGGGDDIYGVIRTDVLRRTPLHDSYHHSDRTITTELALHGPFYQVPEWLYFRRDHPGRAERACPTVRTRCAIMDPRRADRLRHPAVRLYGEYIWGYVAAIRRAPLSSADRRECYRYLARVDDEPCLCRGPFSRQPPVRRGARCPLLPGSLRSYLGRHRGRRPGEEAFVTFAWIHRRRERSGRSPESACSASSAPAISVTTSRWKSVVSYLSADHPDAIVDAMCTGSGAGQRAVWRRGHPSVLVPEVRTQASGVTAIVLKTLGKVVDAFRTASWVRRHDVVIVPGVGVLEASLPSAAMVVCRTRCSCSARPGSLFGTKVALVSVGASVINKRLTTVVVQLGRPARLLPFLS